MRSASANTAVMSCSTSTTENRPLSRRNTSTSRAVSSRPVPAMGSSSSRTLGCSASAMASSSARFSPCASSPAGMCARSAKPTSASAAIAGPFKAASAAARPRMRKLEPARDCTASATFSSAEKPGRIELTWNDRAKPSSARACVGKAVMSRPPNWMVPASGAISPEIWLISVVLPAPFGPMTAWSSRGMTANVRSSVTTSAPNDLRSRSRCSTASGTSEPPRQVAREADEAAAREQDDEHEHRPEDHLPVLGDTGEPFLGEEIGGGPDDGAVERAQPAEQHHHDQFARALPRHVGGADEFRVIGEQEARESRQCARNHVGRELEAIDIEADGRHADGIFLRAAHHAAEARADQGAAEQVSAEETGEDEVIKRALVAQQRQTGERIARRNGEPVVAAEGRERARREEGHLPEGERDHDEVDAAGAQTNHAGQERICRGHGERDRERDERVGDAIDRENADGIGADADEGGVSERDQRAVADEKIERDRGDGEDHHSRSQADEIGAAGKQRHDRNESEREKDASRQRLQAAARASGGGRQQDRHLNGPSPGTSRSAGHRARPPSAGRSASRRWPARRCARAMAP